MGLRGKPYPAPPNCALMRQLTSPVYLELMSIDRSPGILYRSYRLPATISGPLPSFFRRMTRARRVPRVLWKLENRSISERNPDSCRKYRPELGGSSPTRKELRYRKDVENMGGRFVLEELR
ncbi:hypothetical protein KM043_008994 [Ampulex compressa]|nr:hypothetical protein KM043_008994 [Ampulex compressa]